MSLTNDWWRSSLQTSLSQGDIVANLVVANVVHPTTYLAFQTLKGGKRGWSESIGPSVEKQTNRCHVLATAGVQEGKLISHALVISHSCDLDKPDNHRVLVTPVLELEKLPETFRSAVLEQRSRAVLPLPNIPGLPLSCADLRLTTSVPRDVVNASTRVASMTDEATLRLQAQLQKFLINREAP